MTTKERDTIDRRAARWGFAQGYAVTDTRGRVRGRADSKAAALAIAGGRAGWSVYAVIAKEVSRAAA